MKPQKVWTPEKIAYFAKLGETMSQREISDHTGYSYSRVNSVCYHYKIPTQPHKRKGTTEPKYSTDLDFSFLCRRWG